MIAMIQSGAMLSVCFACVYVMLNIFAVGIRQVNNSTLRLELVDSQMLEAAFNRTLSKPIVSTPGKLVHVTRKVK